MTSPQNLKLKANTGTNKTLRLTLTCFSVVETASIFFFFFFVIPAAGLKPLPFLAHVRLCKVVLD